MRRAVFLDRDGTIIEDVGYLRDPNELRLFSGSAEAIRLLERHGFAIVVVTNQSGIARGLLDETDLASIHERLRGELRSRGASLDGIYYCPHHPEVGTGHYRKDCSCRKPRTGMVRRAVTDLDITLRGSFVVGDKASDVELGRRLGCRTVLIVPQQAAEMTAPEELSPDFVASDLRSAATWILNEAEVGV